MANTLSHEVDLVLFMGQSNMAGRGTAEDAPAVPPGAAYEFRAISDPTKLYHLAEPFGAHENNEASGIAEMTKTGSMVSAFAIEYHRLAGRPVVGVSCSKGGTSINRWQPNGTFLRDAIARYRSASDWLTGNGFVVRNRFMVWCQGETDGDRGMTKAEYAEKLKALIDAMIEEGLETCYVVRIGNHRDRASLYNDIIDAQTELCKTYKHAVLVSTKFASMAADGLMKDEFHYVQKAYNIVGAEAGMNAAFHVLTGKEPSLYDPKTQSIYLPNK
ncbi:sialate O-acetylesterase [Paenibacillus sp.]|uniref:sialate O-acetylesterase n=1 Tax=Paenibacillus sp. TaxID=58172 RepID=UPI002D433556|nr:sialate O-acetylesterase [Paenibacillus sp.]HZG84014.1 sialate O-acetylesterase [Paenibacillus sp.]